MDGFDFLLAQSCFPFTWLCRMFINFWLISTLCRWRICWSIFFSKYHVNFWYICIWRRVCIFKKRRKYYFQGLHKKLIQRYDKWKICTIFIGVAPRAEFLTFLSSSCYQKSQYSLWGVEPPIFISHLCIFGFTNESNFWKVLTSNIEQIKQTNLSEGSN